MTRPTCQCGSTHQEAKRVVITGGPGAGKTAVVDELRKTLCDHVLVLPEAASILFSRGFPLSSSASGIKLIQRSLFRIQDDLERSAITDGSVGLVLCNRGVLDGLAYWPEPESSFFAEMRITREEAFKRYDLVIHLRPPKTEHGHPNPGRLEYLDSPQTLDLRIAETWSGHRNRAFVDDASDFQETVQQTVGLLQEVLPPCCQHHAVLA
jgi:predicted ATPase